MFFAAPPKRREEKAALPEIRKQLHTEELRTVWRGGEKQHHPKEGMMRQQPPKRRKQHHPEAGEEGSTTQGGEGKLHHTPKRRREDISTIPKKERGKAAPPTHRRWRQHNPKGLRPPLLWANVAFSLPSSSLWAVLSSSWVVVVLSSLFPFGGGAFLPLSFRVVLLFPVVLSLSPVDDSMNFWNTMSLRWIIVIVILRKSFDRVSSSIRKIRDLILFRSCLTKALIASRVNQYIILARNRNPFHEIWFLLKCEL